MFQPGMEADHRQGRNGEAARPEIGLHQRSLGRLRAAPDGERRFRPPRGVAVGPGRWHAIRPAQETDRPSLADVPDTTPPKRGDHVTLIASGMAAHEHLAVAGIDD
jgi:hypothetical protein